MEAIFGFDWYDWLNSLIRHCTVCYASGTVDSPRRRSVVIGYPTGFV